VDKAENPKKVDTRTNFAEWHKYMAQESAILLKEVDDGDQMCMKF
jgi:hypothetical protein